MREFAIMLYLMQFRLYFNFFKLFPQRDKTIFVTYFGYNALYTMEAIERYKNERIIIIKNKHNHVTFDKKGNRTILDLSKFNAITWCQFIYHLATSNKVIVDNYYGFLAVTNFKKGTVCVQLWHAAGAIKKFGLKDESVVKRSKAALQRFTNVYDRFTHVVVGSDEMATIFKESFALSDDRILYTGIPRTDFFFNEQNKEDIKNKLYQTYPMLREKKVILYAPTFRDHQMDVRDFPFDVDSMYKHLAKDYVLIVKHHPLVKHTSEHTYPDFLLDLSTYGNVNHLLLVADILISDYSSIPFEFALLEKPMIFYTYDLEEYIENRGVWGNYEELVPGEIVRTTDEIIRIIEKQDFDMERIISFKHKWNKYSNGISSDQLVKAIYK